MARLVRFTRTGPYKIEPQQKTISICGCGLSQNLPFCDASHKRCVSECEGVLDVYDEDRREIRERRADTMKAGGPQATGGAGIAPDSGTPKASPLPGA